MPEALSFCLARAQRPLLHVDRSAHLKVDTPGWFHPLTQQHSSGASSEPHPSCQDGPSTAGITPRLQLVKDQSTLYLGEVSASTKISQAQLSGSRSIHLNQPPYQQHRLKPYLLALLYRHISTAHAVPLQTCVFYLTLGNQGNSEVSSVTVKVECSVEQGSSSVLYDNSQSPLPQLPPTARHEFMVQTDVREQGTVSIVASAVFTGEQQDKLVQTKNLYTIVLCV